jgi:hypothetical protein
LDYSFSNSSMNGDLLGKRIRALQPKAEIFIASSMDHGVDGFDVISKSDYEIRKITSNRKKN